MEQLRLFLDEWVPPHRLVNISAFEEDHPNQGGLFNVVALVRGALERPLQPPAGQRTDSAIGKIYSYEVKQSRGGWEAILGQGLAAAESRECGTLSTFNLSNN